MKKCQSIVTGAIVALGLMIPAFSMATTILNINKADLATLEKVKFLGAKKAKLLVDYRQQHGDFKSVEDLTKVKGFGKKTLARIEAKNEVKLSTTSENPSVQKRGRLACLFRFPSGVESLHMALTRPQTLPQPPEQFNKCFHFWG